MLLWARVALWGLAFSASVVRGHAAMLDPMGVTSLGTLNVTEPIPISPDRVVFRDVSLFDRNSVNTMTRAEISGRRITSGSGLITLTGETIYGTAQSGLVVASATGEFVGTSSVNLVAPVPLPAASHYSPVVWGCW
jgi:hypothetical protein